MQVEPINDAYCYIIESTAEPEANGRSPESSDEQSLESNDANQIRIIHSINDDMYQVESIIKDPNEKCETKFCGNNLIHN